MFFYFALPLTLVIFFLSKALFKRKPWSLFHPFLLSMTTLILLHLVFNLDFQQYKSGTKILTLLLEPAVVALAIPLFLQIHLIKQKLNIILISCLLSVCIAFSVAFYILPMLGAQPIISASLASQSITTAIAVEVSRSLGGILSLTAVMVVFVGLLGSTVGRPFLHRIGVKDKQAVGLAIGCASHVLGTAKLLEDCQEEGAFSSLALIVCAIFSALLMPVFYMLLF
ncbi:LrgB family protein [Psychromonas sp. Urea-02u-13]|uniref:LrgB family protein n=1 Tax=Psychromonas sp. Urea-02u-13 TaxID=2058326 RepID=UPI000C324472|nr:LrgB family protein [Psychromonas sp. Urea-02u-13]PKG37429.1 LrgB family protein [Psychromonas sp. Urea-02u-13]